MGSVQGPVSRPTARVANVDIRQTIQEAVDPVQVENAPMPAPGALCSVSGAQVPTDFVYVTVSTASVPAWVERPVVRGQTNSAGEFGPAAKRRGSHAVRMRGCLA